MPATLTDKIDAFRQISQMRLIGLLNSIGGKKDLIIDGSVLKPLDRFIGAKLLRSHGVDKIFQLDKTGVTQENPCLIYLIRADLITLKRVCDQINASTVQRQNHLIIIPRVFHSFEILIEEEGLYGRVKLHSFPWELTNLDKGCLSFESPEIFRFSFVARDQSYITPMARSLWSLQHIFGKIPFKMFLGQHSKAISNVVNVLDEDKQEAESFDSDIGFLLVVDRDIDYATPLLTAGTYASLVDEVLDINTGCIEVKKTLQGGKITTEKMLLTSDDKIYSNIKHQNFAEVLLYLKTKINDIKASKAKRQNMTIQEMKKFVEKELKDIAIEGQIVANHLHVSEKIMQKIGQIFEDLQTCQQDILNGSSRKECLTFIEEIITSRENFHLALRLIALLSLTQNGLYQSEANSLKMQILHAFGYEHLTTFYNLEKMGLFSVINNNAESTGTYIASKVLQALPIQRRSAFTMTAEKLKLFPVTSEEYSVKNQKDAGYVFGGLYIPVIVQIVNLVVSKDKKDAKTLRDLLRKLPTESSEPVVIGKTPDSGLDICPRSVMVYVVGGITHAELAGFAFLEKKEGCTIICGGSSIINGKRLIQSAVQ